MKLLKNTVHNGPYGTQNMHNLGCEKVEEWQCEGAQVVVSALVMAGEERGQRGTLSRVFWGKSQGKVDVVVFLTSSTGTTYPHQRRRGGGVGGRGRGWQSIAWEMIGSFGTARYHTDIIVFISIWVFPLLSSQLRQRQWPTLPNQKQKKVWHFPLYLFYEWDFMSEMYIGLLQKSTIYMHQPPLENERSRTTALQLYSETHTIEKGNPARLPVQLAVCCERKKYSVLGRLEQPIKKGKNLLYRHEEPNEPTKGWTLFICTL